MVWTFNKTLGISFFQIRWYRKAKSEVEILMYSFVFTLNVQNRDIFLLCYIWIFDPLFDVGTIRQIKENHYLSEIK